MKKEKGDFSNFEVITTKLDQILGGKEMVASFFSGRGRDARTGGYASEYCVSYDDGSFKSLYFQ